MAKRVPLLSPEEIQSVIAIAWDDKPPFPAVLRRHGLSPGQIVQPLRGMGADIMGRQGGNLAPLGIRPVRLQSHEKLECI